jgi:DNA-binding beta-propeller fold protein YncE
MNGINSRHADSSVVRRRRMLAAGVLVVVATLADAAPAWPQQLSVSTLAGLAGSLSYGSADGTGSTARFNTPRGVAVDGAGTVYVADSGNHRIRKVTAAGVVTTLAGLAGVPGARTGW